MFKNKNQKNQRRGIIMENSKKEIYKALVQTINDLQNPTNTMDNPYFKSKYVPLSDIIDIVKPVMKKYGLTFLQPPYVMYEVVQHQGKNGTVYNNEIAVIKVVTTLIHESGETLEFPPMIMKAQGNTPQNIGSTITYARRYSLTSILGIAGKEEDDDGYMAGSMQMNQQGQQYAGYSGQNQPNQQSQQQQNQPKEQAKSNIDMSKVVAKVTKKSDGTSGKGTPYVELTLEKDGQFITAMAKDEGVYQLAKGIKEGSEASFKIVNANGLNFISAIDVQEAKS